MGMARSDLEVGLLVLTDIGIEAGRTPEQARAEALAIAAYDAEFTGRLASSIAAKRAELEAADEQAAAERHAATPEGRAEAAREALKKQAERAELVAGSKALLAEQGIDASDFSDEEALHASGVAPQFSMLNIQERDAAHLDLAARWSSLTPEQQREQAAELEISTASLDRYVAVMEGRDTEAPHWSERGQSAEGAGGGDGE